MAKIGSIGSKLDLLIKRGSDFGVYTLTIRNAEKLPIDLTNYTFSGGIKKSHSLATILAEIVFTPIDLVNGKIGISVPNASTTLLKGNSTGLSEYVYDIDMTDDNGLIEPLFYGDVEVFSNV